MNVSLRVYGSPAPQGSKRAMLSGKGRPFVREQQSDRIVSWRADVMTAARKAIDEGAVPFVGPIQVSVAFLFARPKSHYRTGRNAHLLRDDAPKWVTEGGKGDLDKLLRSTFDALTASGLIADDRLIASVESFKTYDHGEAAGADIYLESLT